MRDAVSRYSTALRDPLHVPLAPRKVVTAVAKAIRSAQPLTVLGALPASDGTQANEIHPESEVVTVEEIIDLNAPNCPIVIVPTDWIKGQLLNVRNKGEYYAVTLLGEEEDPRYPLRTLRFSNPALCQDFVSKWYQREHHDPRAF